MLIIIIGYNAYNLCLCTTERIQTKGTPPCDKQWPVAYQT